MEFRIEHIQERIREPDAEERARARDDVRALARPRLAGSDGAAEVEADLRARFEDLGYTVEELPFSFSAAPGRYGPPVIGALLLIGAGIAVWLLLEGLGAAGLFAILVTLSVIGLLAVFSRTLIRRVPWERVDTANWLVRRPGATPRYLVLAHRDSKSQPLPLSLRAVAIVLAAIATLALLAQAILAALDPAWLWAPLVIGTGVAAGLGALGLILCWAGNDSPGALDNASGLAALLGIARRERDSDDIAFVVTDGEELGLAGAWALTEHLPPVLGAINLDGLDDSGSFHVVEQYGLPRRGLAPHLAAALLSAAHALGMEAERRSLPPGLLVDHIPLVEAGLPAVTLMRGGRRSLGRVHRPGDDAERIGGDGVAAATAVVEGALQLLRMPASPSKEVLPEGLRTRG